MKKNLLIIMLMMSLGGHFSPSLDAAEKPLAATKRSNNRPQGFEPKAAPVQKPGAKAAPKQKQDAKGVKKTGLQENNKKPSTATPGTNQPIYTVSHTFSMQVADGGGFPFPNSEFDYTVDLLVNQGQVISMSLPQLNFQTYASYAPGDWVQYAPFGGILTTFANPLPEMYLPKNDLTFVASTNDGYMQGVDFDTYSPGPPVSGVSNPVAAYNVIIDTYGNLTITACGTYLNVIPPGGHTLNGTVVPYQVSVGSCDCHNDYTPQSGFNEFIIQPAFTNFSLYTGRAANDGIRDLHANDANGNLAAWTWGDNSAQTDKSNDNILMDAYVALADLSGGGVRTRTPINISNYTIGSQRMALDSSIAINKNQTRFPGNVLVSYDDLYFQSQLNLQGNIKGKYSNIIININTTNLDLGYLVSDSLGYVPEGTTITAIGTNQITLSNPTTYPMNGASPVDTIEITTGVPLEFTGDILEAGSNIISNVPTNVIAQLTGAYGNPITDTLGYIPAGTTINTVLPDNTVQLSQNMTNTAPVTGDTFIQPRTWGTSGTFRPSNAAVAVSNNGGRTFGAPFVIDPTLNFPNASVGDCPGVQSDKFGNIWYMINVDQSGFYTALNLRFYVSGDGGRTWHLYFQTTDAVFDNNNPANSTGTYDYPTFCFGNDGLGNYGIWFAAAFFTAESGYFNNDERLGFLPITGLYPAITPIPPANSTDYYTTIGDNQPNLLNTIGLVTPAAKSDGTLFLGYPPSYSQTQQTVGNIALAIKPPGGFDTPLLGPWTIDQLANQWSASVASYPYGLGRPYFPMTFKSMIVDDVRGAIYAIVCEQINFFSQNYNLFLMASIDDGVTWSGKYPLASTTSQNRGFQSATLNPADQCLYVGYYDARNKDPNPPAGTVPYSSLQFYGVQLTKSYLDNLVNSLQN